MENQIHEFPPQTDRFLSEFVKMLGTLGLIIALMLIVAWFLKRMMSTRMEQMNSASAIKVLERRSLSPKTALYLLEVGNKVILIGESQTGVCRLTEYPANQEGSENSSDERPSAFSRIMEAKDKERGS